MRTLWQQIQSFVGARPDGDPGAETARLVAEKLGMSLDPAPVVPGSVWPRDTLAEMTAFYGPPANEGALVLFEAPYPLFVDGVKTTKMRTHAKIAPAVVRVLEKTLSHYGWTKLHNLKLSVYDGCYSPRMKRGGTTWSTHAYGAALDFCAEKNSLHQDHTTALFAGPDYEAWWRFWEEEGAVSLGRSRDYDYMHVQFANLV